MPVPKRFVSNETILSATNLNKVGMRNFQVHAQASPNMTVYIEDGVALIAGTIVKYAGGNSPTLTAPTGGNKRIDLITIDSAGTIAVTQGTQGASPSAPTYPTDKLVLAEIYLRDSATQIKDEDDSSQCYIYRDSRTFTIPPAAITAKFGGTGADGALSISSGTTTIDLGSAAVVIKNYTSISITGTAKLAFSNPHANGTIIILKSQGAVTITSSTVPAIDVRLMGGTGGNGSTSPTNGSDGNGNVYTRAGYAGTYDTYNYVPPRGGFGAHIMGLTPCKAVLLACGAGGGGGEPWFGSIGGGAGGRGGGALYIECGGALNITSTINASGADGANGGSAGGGGSTTIGGGGGGGGAKTDGGNGGNAVNPAGDVSGGGGGGGGGSIVILYASLTANSGTYTVTGGAGGSGSGRGCDGGAGGEGYSLVAANTEFL